MLALCSKVRQTATKLARAEHLQKLQRSFQKACGAPSAETVPGMDCVNERPEVSTGLPEKPLCGDAVTGRHPGQRPSGGSEGLS